ncbi:E3 ubiquitin-protein ligase TRIM11-like [Monodelphis domestica]|uniref:E3 ubiquitin-protein ligase TRIM11-like n=1 Tax=Monodelphis domestica TaxID=13616 RepID=UPI0024E1E174|nr:E3 ubiquitin-protein ligase TRIM11-like [Monodelphis domestica]
MANHEEVGELCMICFERDPVTVIVECGHAICMICLRNQTSPPSCCTECWEFSQQRTLHGNGAMHPEGEGVCEIHQEDQKLFCDRNQTLLCMTCSKSEDHKDEFHWPIAVAAFRYREEIQENLIILHEHLEKVEELLSEENKLFAWGLIWPHHKETNENMDPENFPHPGEFPTRTEGSREDGLTVVKENKRLRKLFQELKEMEMTQEYQIMEEKKKWEDMMSNQRSMLTDIITEIKEKIQKPDIEMLQNVTETLRRSSLKLDLKLFTPKLTPSYIFTVMKFSRIFQKVSSLGHKLGENCKYYNLSEDRQRTIDILSLDSCSGFTQTVYIAENVLSNTYKQGYLILTFSEKLEPPSEFSRGTNHVESFFLCRRTQPLIKEYLNTFDNLRT